MKICSPMPKGNGAYIVHEQLSNNIDSYSLHSYHQNLTLFPPALSLFGCAGADIIHTTPDYGIFFKKKGSKLVLTFHNYVLDDYMSGCSTILQNIHYRTDLKLFTKLSVNHADSMTAVSNYTAALVKKDLSLNQDLRVIYNGIDETLFKPVNNEANSKEVTVLFAGNTSIRKGFDFLPKLVPYLNKNIKILYTTGLRNKRKGLSSEKLINVGSIRHKDMPALYQKADILIYPSIREGFGLSVAEAMSCGLPIIAFNTSSLPELIEHELGGYLTEINDERTFAAYINKLADAPELRKEMGRYNREIVETRFTQRIMIDNYREYFEEIYS